MKAYYFYKLCIFMSTSFAWLDFNKCYLVKNNAFEVIGLAHIYLNYPPLQDIECESLLKLMAKHFTGEMASLFT